nr:unnamed protein product [Spirometra erinaceieuropaei]
MNYRTDASKSTFLLCRLLVQQRLREMLDAWIPRQAGEILRPFRISPDSVRQPDNFSCCLHVCPCPNTHGVHYDDRPHHRFSTPLCPVAVDHRHLHPPCQNVRGDTTTAATSTPTTEQNSPDGPPTTTPPPACSYFDHIFTSRIGMIGHLRIHRTATAARLPRAPHALAAPALTAHAHSYFAWAYSATCVPTTAELIAVSTHITHLAHPATLPSRPNQLSIDRSARR